MMRLLTSFSTVCVKNPGVDGGGICRERGILPKKRAQILSD